MEVELLEQMNVVSKEFVTYLQDIEDQLHEMQEQSTGTYQTPTIKSKMMIKKRIDTAAILSKWKGVFHLMNMGMKRKNENGVYALHKIPITTTNTNMEKKE